MKEPTSLFSPAAEAHQRPGAEIDLRAIWGALLRRKWIALAMPVAALVIGALVTWRAPRIYRAVATVMIEHATPEVLGKGVKEVYDLGTPSFWNTREYYETQYKVIRSRPVAQRAASLLGINSKSVAERLRTAGPEALAAKAAVDPLHGLPENLRDRLSMLGVHRVATRSAMLEALGQIDVPAAIVGKIEVEPVKDSRLAKIVVEDTNPEHATQIANAVVDAYVTYNLEQKTDFTRSAVDWLSDQIVDLKAKLEESEFALYGFKKANNMVSVSMEDRQTITSERLSNLNNSLSEAQAERFTLESSRNRLNRAKAGDGELDLHETILQSPVIERLKISLSELQQQISELSTKYTANHPKITALRERSALVRDDLDSEVAKIVDNLEMQYRDALDTEHRLKREIDRVKAEALEIKKKEIDYNRLKRERDNNQELFTLVLKRQKEAELTQMLKVNNVRKHEPALAPKAPVRPNVPMNLLLSLVIGLLAGLGLAFLVDYLDNTIKSQSQVENVLGLPFLGILPAIRSDRSTPKIVDVVDRDHYIVAHPRSSVAECCRTIRTNLLFMSPESPARRFLVTSSGPREGKSTTALNLAVTMAQAGASTILVDTDMRRPRLHKSFSLDNENGISNVVLGEVGLSAVVHRSADVNNLHVLTCGPIPPNPAELLHTDSFRQIVDELSSRFDRVLFDSPPVAAVTDAMVLSSMVDGVVLVVHAGQTSWQAALQARRQLEDVGGRVFGVVLNNVNLDDKRSGDYYQYYYYYYRSRYTEDEQNEKQKRAV